MDDLKSLYLWFDKNRASIISGHEMEEVLLNANSVIGYFKTENDALSEAKSRGLKLGDFLIQTCVAQEKEHLACFSPEVQFV
mgnify:CR=1